MSSAGEPLPHDKPHALKALQGESEGSAASQQNVIKIYSGGENQKPPN